MHIEHCANSSRKRVMLQSAEAGQCAVGRATSLASRRARATVRATPASSRVATRTSPTVHLCAACVEACTPDGVGAMEGVNSLFRLSTLLRANTKAVAFVRTITKTISLASCAAPCMQCRTPLRSGEAARGVWLVVKALEQTPQLF